VIEFVDLCKSHGFSVHHVVVDPEAALAALVGKIPDVIVVVVSKGQHVKKAERGIRWIKERVRSILHSLPYQLPLSCFPHLVSFVAQRINCLPRQSLGPVAANELFTGRKFDYAKDGKTAFGDYVVVAEPDSDNTMKSRARLCITLCPRTNLSVNWALMDIERGTFITRSVWKENPMPIEAVERVNEIARADKRAFEQYAVDQPLLGDETEPTQEETEEDEPPGIPAVIGHAPPVEDLPRAVNDEEDTTAPQGEYLAQDESQKEIDEES
jgi:hypothetical protein